MQELKNSKGKKYIVEDQLPNRINEGKKKLGNMSWRNKKLVADTLEMQFQKGKLMVAGEEYVSKMIVPKHEDLIGLKDDEIEELNKIQVVKGMEYKEGTSTFIAYAAEVQDYDDVNKAYEYVMNI